MTTDPPLPVTPRDLFLARELSDSHARAYLAERGFREPVAADEHLQQLADDLPTRLALGELAEVLLDTLIDAADPDAALVGFCRYVTTRIPKSSFLGYLHDDPRSLQILTRLLGASPFLSELLIRNPEYLHWLQRQLDRPPPDLVDYHAELETLLTHDSDAARHLDALKRLKRREMLRIAGRDLMGKDTLRSTTEQLSNLADIVTEGAIRIVRAQMDHGDARSPQGSFVVIGMGKLGGRELNYSSDIDLIYVYEADETDDPRAHERFQELGRRLTAALGEHTDEGYFYRVDLRLRPMGKRGNVVYSLQQCAQYYESWGETFERFALIKARPIAGDVELGQRFLEMIRPFVYRKYLDHAAIEELAGYKVRADRGHAQHDATDRNVKLGRGGIREIELFTQVFQLIYGGRHTELQDANTLSAVEKVHQRGLVDETVTTALTQAYEFLRTVEHRLQVVQGGHTHTLSNEAQELEVTARRMSFETAAELTTALDAHRDRVHAIYTNLLERRSEDAEFQGRQMFRLLSGELPDQDAVEHLRTHGLPDAEAALQAVRALDAAPSLAHSKTSGRNLLANLLATMLGEVAQCAFPGHVLNRFEQVVVRSGTTASLYTSLLENDALRRRLLKALDTGALFAERLSRYPELLDFLVAPSLDATAFERTLRTGLAQIGGETLDDAADPFRRFKAIEEFKVLIEWLDGGTLHTLNQKLSLTADAGLGWAAARAAEEHLYARDADPAAGSWAVAALGKLGGRELTVHSDLDLVFLYQGDPSDSARFERQQGFVRAIHQFIERPTGEGRAYRLDTRLRPEGKKGAIAIPVIAFRRYLDTRAEIWERMAWTRCRFIAGAPDLVEEAEDAIRTFVYGPWDPNIPTYARHLRTRMERELAREATGRRLDLKVGHGGLADIDFVLQLVQLREGAHRQEFRIAGTRALLETLPETVYLSNDQVDRLKVAYEFLRTLETVIRIESDSSIGWISTDSADLQPLSHHLGLVPPTGDAVLSRYREVTAEIRSIYEESMTRLST